MLTTRDTMILETEDRFPRRTGKKTDHIIHVLGLAPAVYYARLHRLVRRRDVIELYPQLAYRVGRLSEKRTEEREALKRMIS